MKKQKDSFAVNVIGIILNAFVSFLGMAVGFANCWQGWVFLAFGIGGASYFIYDMERMSKRQAEIDNKVNGLPKQD